jgi:hypothetical protein
METGVYLPGLFAGFAIPLAAAFVWGVFYVAWRVLVELIEP